MATDPTPSAANACARSCEPGAALLVDRTSGAGHSITYWDGAASMEASEQAVVPLRERVAQAGAQLGEIDRLEIVIQERTQPARANTSVRVNDFRGTPANVDE